MTQRFAAPSFVDGHYPPGFEGAPFLYLATVFSILLFVLLTLEWLHRLGWCFFEKPAPLKAPQTIYRVILILLLVGALVRSAPDLWLLMRWPAISPDQRLWLSIFDARMDASAFIFFSVAWLLGRLGDPMISYQLETKPLPVHLWPTWQQMKRPLKIGLGVFVIAFAMTFLR